MISLRRAWDQTMKAFMGLLTWFGGCFLVWKKQDLRIAKIFWWKYNIYDWRCFFCPLAVWRESTQTEFGKVPNTLASYWSMPRPPGPLIGRTHTDCTVSTLGPRMETDLGTCLRWGRSQSPPARGDHCAEVRGLLFFSISSHKITTRIYPENFGI